MSLLRSLGKKHVEIATQWIGSLGVFGTAAGCGVLYFTDWRLILQYMPYYNGKFPKIEE